jgi:hypothetical protein
MGAVWRGVDEVLGRTVAMKKIGVAPGGFTPDALRAEREAKLAAKLNHANVVAVFDLVEEAVDGQSQQWLVMEYVEGTDLAELIRQRGRLTPDEAAPILAQTASALAAAHGAGIVHRDVKPSNILVAPGGQVKLSDFGIARTSSDPSLTQTGLVTGSPAYLSPEVASGQQAAPSSDVWSWGATLYHALEGRPPYQVGDNLLGALYRIVHEEPPRTAYAGWLAPALEATMTRDPAARWPIATAQAFLEAGPQSLPAVATAGGLATVGLGGTHEVPVTRSDDDEGGTQLLPFAPVPGDPPAAPAAPARGADGPRRPWVLAALAVVAVVVATVIAFVIGTHGDDGGPSAKGTPSASTTGSSARTSPSAEAPTADGMKTFVEDYIATASTDPETAFGMLTPSFQVESHGLSAYEDFWSNVADPKVMAIKADPETLRVRYTYHYRLSGEPRTEHIELQLTHDAGTYLIDDEL